MLFSSIENLVFNLKFQYFLVKTEFFTDTNGFSIYNTVFFFRKRRFQCKISVFHLQKRCFLTIQTDFPYIILFFSIENFVFDVKFQYFLAKTLFFKYTKGFSIHNAIFFCRKPRFQFKISVFPCKNGVF